MKIFCDATLLHVGIVYISNLHYTSDVLVDWIQFFAKIMIWW